MVAALDHVIVAVRDLADATRRYATLYARRPSWRGEHPGQGTAKTLFRLHNTYLDLLDAAGGGRRPARPHARAAARVARRGAARTRVRDPRRGGRACGARRARARARTRGARPRPGCR